MKEFVGRSRDKFSDQEFGHFYHQRVAKEIDKAALLMDSFIRYTRAATPVLKTGTLHRLIEEALKKKKGQLEEKRIRLSLEFENDLPETTLPDEHLKFILDSALDYATASILSGGRLGLTTKVFSLLGGLERVPIFPLRDGKCIEILLTLSDHKTVEERVREEPGIPSLQGEELRGLELRLVEQVVRRNRGRMEFKFNGKKGIASISFKLPVERRKIFYYPSANEARQERSAVSTP